ncbi:MAG: CAP domain-containing protein [Microthrixaceae bacterium]
MPLLLIGSALAVARAAAGEAPAQAEVGFADYIGQERSARGMSALAPASDLQAVARRHAQRMAERGEPYHNPNLGSEVDGWAVVSENVGAGSNVAQIHDAFMASKTHRDIILSGELTELGVGVVAADGQLWVVEVFRRPSQAAAAPAQPGPSLPRTDQAPSAAPARPAPPTTVAPPPVVTTAPPPPPATTIPDDELTGRSNGSAAFGVIAAVSPSAVPVPDAPERGVPGVAWLAAALLIGVVTFQIKALRSSKLLG